MNSLTIGDRDNSNELAFNLLHIITTLILITIAADVSINPLIIGLNAGERSVPNIVLILADDHGYQALSCYGSNRNKTPNLDRIANEGMLFNRCFVTNSICGPSRAVILTGKYSHLNGFERNGRRFNGEQQTVAKLLQKTGYQTAIVGKWHLGTEPTGFDYYHRLVGQGPYYNPVMRTNDGELDPKTGYRTVKHTGYTTDIITDQALKFLKEKRDPEKPFFLMYQHKAPHRNWQPGPKYLNKYDDVTLAEPETLFDDYKGRGSAAKQQAMTVAGHLSPNDLKTNEPRGLTDEQKAVWKKAYGPKNEAFKKANLEGDDLIRWKYQRYAKDYLRCIDSVDENVGRVLDYLDETGLAKNTIVIYTSDQGWYLGEHGWYDKRWMYEESFRTPLMVRWPDKIKPGSVNDTMVMNLDFPETFLEIAGAEIPADMQGRSIVPVLQDKTPPDWRTSVYYHYYEFPGAHNVRRHLGVRTKTHKLIHFYRINEWELFDLEKDPNELKSVYDDPAYADTVKELKKELARLRDHYKDDGTVVEFPNTAKPPKRPKRKKPKRDDNASKLPPTSEVSGIVTLNGKPVADADVAFIIEKGGYAARTKTDASGKYTIQAYRGKNRVAITKTEFIPTGEKIVEAVTDKNGNVKEVEVEVIETKHLLPAAFASPNVSPLRVDVQMQKQAFNFVLSD